MPKVSAASPATLLPNPATGAPVAPLGIAVPPGVPPPRLGSANPDTFTQGGLADKFNGRVLAISLLPRKYKTGRKANTYSGFAELTIQADDTSVGKDGIVTEYYNVTGLNQWVPSRTDPVWNGSQWVYTPAGGTLDLYMKLHAGEAGFPVPNGQPGETTALMPPDDWRGYYWVPGAQNSKDSMAKGTKWDQFLTQLKLAGYFSRAPHVSPTDMRQFLVGVYGHWVRLPFEFSGGQAPAMEPGQQQGKIDTLCLAEILDLGPISGAGGTVPQFAGSVPAPAGGGQLNLGPVAQVPAASPVASTLGPVSAAATPATASPAGLTARNDPAAISAAANEILTAMAVQRGTAGLTKAEAGVAVFEGVNARGLDGAMGLRYLNSNDWIEADERTFGYVAEKGLLVPLG